MASRRLSLSTNKLPKYSSLPSHADPAPSSTVPDDDDPSRTAGGGPASAPPGVVPPRLDSHIVSSPIDYPPSPQKSSKWLPPRPASPASSASLPPPFNLPWRGDSRPQIDLQYLLHHHLPRRLFVVGLGLTAFVLVSILGAAFDVPVINYARSFGLFSPGRVYDREDAYRWKGVSSTKGPQDEVPFLLARLGYSRRTHDDRPVPSILHVVPPGKGVFSYLQWLSIASGVTQIAPERTIAHMFEGSVPSRGENFWWDEAVRLPGFEVREVPDVKEVFGRPVYDISHKADVVRMQVMREYGGVYMDTDVLILRGFGELMTGKEEMVMGVEKALGSMNEPTDIEGLCNAVMVTKKGSRFMEKWWQNYRTFGGQSFHTDRENSWNYHSVQLPWMLAKNATANQTPITVLDHRAFFAPLWDDMGLHWVHGTIPPPPSPPKPTVPVAPPTSPEAEDKLPPPPSSRFRFALADLDSPLSSDFDQEDVSEDREKTLHGSLAPGAPGWAFGSTGQYAYHMWHTLLKENIARATDGAIRKESDLGPDDALERDSSFNRVARKYLTQEVVARWRSWKERERIKEDRRKGMQSFRDWSGPLAVRDDAKEGSLEPRGNISLDARAGEDALQARTQQGGGEDERE